MVDKLKSILTLLESGKSQQALAKIRKVNSKKEVNYDSLMIEAICYIKLGLRERYTTLLERHFMLALSDNSLLTACENISIALVKSENFEDCIRYIDLAIEGKPKHRTVKLRYRLAKCCVETSQYNRALSIFNSLLVYKEFTIPALQRLVSLGILLADYRITSKYLKMLESYADDLGEVGLFSLIEKTQAHLDTDVSYLLDVARKKGFNVTIANLFAAKNLYMIGKKLEALELLEEITPESLPIENSKASYFNLKGRILSENNRIDEAFQQFELMNQLVSTRLPNNWKLQDRLVDYRNLTTFKKRQSSFNCPIEVAFLVGFPRSGTTLLEQVLDSQEEVVALGERPTLRHIERKIEEDGYKYPDDLSNLPDEYVEQLRLLYFHEVEKYVTAGSLSDYKILIDKNPFYMIKLPLVLTLFPDAKILLALRHPLDCILSCFQQNFAFRRNLAFFTDWNLIFERYRDVFDLYQGYRKHMQWAELIVKYEQLVSDFEVNIEEILHFLGIPPNKKAYLSFSTKAKKSIITTPSKNQVRSGIYLDAKFKWENYASYFQSNWKTVKPYIDEFGYSATTLEDI